MLPETLNESQESDADRDAAGEEQDKVHCSHVWRGPLSGQKAHQHGYDRKRGATPRSSIHLTSLRGFDGHPGNRPAGVEETVGFEAAFTAS